MPRHRQSTGSADSESSLVAIAALKQSKIATRQAIPEQQE
jgi:hypothetical protein